MCMTNEAAAIKLAERDKLVGELLAALEWLVDEYESVINNEFGTTAHLFNAPGADKAIAALPTALGSLAAICGLATPVLGIASYFRGKMQADPRIPTDNRG